MQQSIIPERKCNVCQLLFPLTANHWHKSKAHSGGFVYTCKTCASIKAKASRANHLEEDRERSRAWRKLNPEKYADYIATHSEQIADGKRDWRERNPDKVKQHKENDRKRNPQSQERRLQRHREKHPLRAKAREAVTYAVRIGKLPRVWTLKCAHCGNPAQQYHHHYGYEPEHWLDVIPLCKPCHWKIDHPKGGAA